MNRILQTTWKVLLVTFGLIPLIAGIDKFFHVLVDWDMYLSQTFAAIIPFEVSTTMAIVGIIEIIAGLIVFIRPRVGALMVMVWDLLIVVNLLFGGFYDIAVRDIGLSVGAFALWQLSRIRHAGGF